MISSWVFIVESSFFSGKFVDDGVVDIVLASPTYLWFVFFVWLLCVNCFYVKSFFDIDENRRFVFFIYFFC